MSKSQSECSFCQLVDVLAREGRLDEEDAEIVARHLLAYHYEGNKSVRRRDRDSEPADGRRRFGPIETGE
jgi:hypothetical protein